MRKHELGVTGNHVLVSLASPLYDLALHLCVLSTILTVLATLLLLLYIYLYNKLSYARILIGSHL